MEKKYLKGLFFNEKHPNAPDFVKGSISIKRLDLIEELQNRDDEYIKLDCKINKEGKGYAEINTWKKDNMAESLGGKVVENIPF